jgi:hypothetical protein
MCLASVTTSYKSTLLDYKRVARALLAAANDQPERTEDLSVKRLLRACNEFACLKALGNKVPNADTQHHCHHAQTHSRCHDSALSCCMIAVSTE